MLSNQKAHLSCRRLAMPVVVITFSDPR